MSTLPGYDAWKTMSPDDDRPTCRCGEEMNLCPTCREWTCAVCNTSPAGPFMSITEGCEDHALRLAETELYRREQKITDLTEKLTHISIIAFRDAHKVICTTKGAE